MQKVDVRKVATLTGHRNPVYALTAETQGPHFFSGAGDGMVVQWDLTHPGDGERIAQLPNSVFSLCLMRNAPWLVVGHNYDGLHFVDWRERSEKASLHLTDAPIFDIQQDGSSLVVAMGDGTVGVVDSELLTVSARNQASEKSARAIAIHPAGNEVAVGYSDHFIRVFERKTMKMMREWQAHGNSVFALRYSPDGETLLSGARDARLKAWSVQEGYKLHKEVVAHLFAINHVEYSPDGKHFVTCSMDKSVKVWDASRVELLKVIDKARHAGHGTSVNKLVWSSFNNQLLSASDDRTVSVWELFFKLQTTETQ